MITESAKLARIACGNKAYPKDTARFSYRDAEGHAREITFFHWKKANLVLRIISHPERQHILALLLQNEGKTISELMNALQLKQYLLYKHLFLLDRAGAIAKERIGKTIKYTANEERLSEIFQHVCEINRCPIS